MKLAVSNVDKINDGHKLYEVLVKPDVVINETVWKKTCRKLVKLLYTNNRLFLVMLVSLYVTISRAVYLVLLFQIFIQFWIFEHPEGHRAIILIRTNPHSITPILPQRLDMSM